MKIVRTATAEVCSKRTLARRTVRTAQPVPVITRHRETSPTQAIRYVRPHYR